MRVARSPGSLSIGVLAASKSLDESFLYQDGFCNRRQLVPHSDGLASEKWLPSAADSSLWLSNAQTNYSISMSEQQHERNFVLEKENTANSLMSTAMLSWLTKADIIINGHYGCASRLGDGPGVIIGQRRRRYSVAGKARGSDDFHS